MSEPSDPTHELMNPDPTSDLATDPLQAQDVAADLSRP